MDDLISRKAVADILTNPAYPYEPGIERAVMRLPSVPAVPLDKLCSMLAKYIGFPCNYSPIDEEMADYCGDQCKMDDIGCWEKVLSKWMEGLDAKAETNTKNVHHL